MMAAPIDMLTDDGHDLQFGTNVLGHFYFTKLVLPTLLSTAKSAPDGIARVVNTSSNGHWFSGLEYDTMKDGPARRNAGPWKLYGQSKTVSPTPSVLLGSIPLMVSLGEYRFRFGADAAVRRPRHCLNCLEPRLVYINLSSARPSNHCSHALNRRYQNRSAAACREHPPDRLGTCLSSPTVSWRFV